MLVHHDADEARQKAFRDLGEIVRLWRSENRTTTTAGLKPAMQQRDPDFSESALGFPAFRDFVVAAADAGHVRTVKLPTGHTMVLLPDEDEGTVTPTDPEREPGTAAKSVPSAIESEPPPGGRLRAEVWTVFIDWQHGQDRRWDTRTNRPFMFPVDPDGRPAWTTSPDRFHPVEPVTQDVQIGWMREWAATLAEPTRAEIVRSLDGGGLGQFRRELDAHGLASEWRSELQRRVNAHVLAWARDHGVPWRDLVDQRARAARPVAPPAAAPHVRPVPAPPAPTAHAPVARSSDGGETARLRALVHHVVDRMSLAELSAVPIRAEHLLDRE